MYLNPRQQSERSSVDKENVNRINKMPGLDAVVHKVSSPQSSAKLRKNSDSTDDRLQRPKGLQVNATYAQINIPRRRVSSTSDDNATKPFVKTRFTIYNEEKSKTGNQSTDKRCSLKFREADKPVKSIYHAKCVPSTLPLAEKSKNEEQTSDESSDVRKSPENLPNITKPDVLKIKERHSKKSIPRKTPKVAYEVLSLELAYNIDYMTEYVRYQMEMNVNKRLSSSFLKNGITADQRRLIVKYLIDATTYYKSPSFILYQAVKIFDAYIDKVRVKLQELQTVALAALWIALKKDLIIDDVPEAETIMKLAAINFKGDKQPLLECEKKILMSLQFEISFADPFSMLALYAIMIEEVRELESSAIQELYYCGSYLIDLSMLDKDLCDVLGVHLAEVSTEIALILIMTDCSSIKDSCWTHWRVRILECNPVLEKYLLDDKDMDYIKNQLLQKAVLSIDKKTDYYAVYKKYSTRRFGAISALLTSKIASLFVSRIIDDSSSSKRPVVF